MATSVVAPHDLLMLHNTRLLQFATLNPPPWVVLALQRAPLVVVRRAPTSGDRLSVGIRGQNRSERWAASLCVAAGEYERIAPEHLVATQAWKRSQRLRQIGAIQALVEITPYLQASGLIWGPTGSVGFELASGVPTATTISDLDLLVRVPQPLSWKIAEAILTTLGQAAVRIDVQIETPYGAIALIEYVQRGPESHTKLLLRTDYGPKSIRDPWSKDEASSECCTDKLIKGGE